MTVATFLIVLAATLAVGAIGFVIGIIVAPAIGRWAERITEGDEDERS